MFVLNTACDDASFLATVLFIKKLVKIITIIIPIVLVLLLSVDIAKAVIASDDNEMKKAQKLVIRRIVYALTIFFVPLVVDATFSLLGEREVFGLSCYNNAIDDVVDVLAQAEKESLLKYEEDTKKLIDVAKQSKQEADKGLNELRQKTPTSSSSSTSNGTNVNPNAPTAEKIASTAERLAWPLGTKKAKYDHNKGGKAYGDFEAIKKKWKVGWKSYDCGTFVEVINREATGNKKIPYIMAKYNKKSFKKSVAKYGFTAFDWNGALSSLQRGDILTYKRSSNRQHVMIYLGNGLVAEAALSTHTSPTTRQYGHISKMSAFKKRLSGKARYYVVRANK